MDRLEYYLVFMSCLFAFGLCQNSPPTFLTVVDIEAPNAIELDGDVDEVVLDCPFVTNNTNDLVVKWFYNGTTDQIYQWIPVSTKKPYAIGHLKPNIDTDYVATNDSLTKYRALKLTNLSPKLSGNYTCKVSNDVNEDMKTHQLTIFAPATSFDMVLYEDSEDVVCSVTMISPKPEIRIIALGVNDTVMDIPMDAIEEDLYEIEVDDIDFTFYNITNTLSLNTTQVNATKFLCVVWIPGTEYSLKKDIEYLSDELTDGSDETEIVEIVESEEYLEEDTIIVVEVNITDATNNLTRKDPNAGARNIYSSVLCGFALTISLLLSIY